MSNRFLIPIALFAWIALLEGPSHLSAQPAAPFDLAVEQNGSITPVTASSTLTLQAPAINQIAAVGLRIRNVRSSQLRIHSAAIGGAGFALDGASIPTNLTLGSSLTIGLRYTAATSARVSGELVISYSDGSTPQGDPNPPQSFFITLQGVAPEFRASYVAGVDGNAEAITVGSTVSFPDTQVSAFSVVTVSLVNAGSGPGVISGVAVSGSGFRAQGLPLFPVALQPGTELRFGVRFTPLLAGPSPPGTLSIRLPGVGIEASLAGSGSSSLLKYELELPGSLVPLTPGQPVDLPETAVGETLLIGIRITNTGNVAGPITSLSLLGAAFAFLQAPTLPVSLDPQGSFTVYVNVAPRDPGLASGQLRIGTTVLELQVVGIGPRLRYSYSLAGVTVAVQPAGSIIFPPTRVGEQSQVPFTLTNTGNRDALIASIRITSGAASYSLAELPALPSRLAAGESVAVTLVFSPLNLDPLTGALAVGSESFPLAGSAIAPPELPTYSFSGVSGNVAQLTQPSVGLTLDSTYPVLLRGRLQITFETAIFVDDPSIQFASGGRFVDFTIPPGTRNAVFANGSTTTRFQTGTVVGSIVLSPTFTVGSLPLRSDNVLRLNLPPAPPRVLSLQVGELSSSGVTFVLSGATPIRSLDSIEFSFQLTDRPPVSISASTVSINVRALADNFFRSAASSTTGGFFFATVPFQLTIGGNNPPALTEIVRGVTVRLVSSEGGSEAMSVTIP